MRTTGKKRAIRNALHRLGLNATPKGIVHALRQQGVHVDEELVRQVRVEMLKGMTASRFPQVARPLRSPAVRRRPQGFPKL